jgi:NAD-dependent dihydropyrimidine dehydrogenase PreA subunit
MESPCGQPGLVVPEIDRTRCEGKADCVTICPQDVFAVRRLAPDELSALPFFSRLKARSHGSRQAFAVREQDCHACGLCVRACPEKAIRLVRVGVD